MMEDLTPRELQLAKLVAAGLSNPQIAQMLVICRQTVKNHIQKVYKKLGVNNRVQLTLRLIGETTDDPQRRVVREGILISGACTAADLRQTYAVR